MQRFNLSAFLTAAALAAGCTATVGYRGGVSSEGYGPDLVYAAPGVQVIADYDEPIFFSDSFYWRYDGATWYRSSTYTGGWVYASPPQAVLRIDRPHRFVHYRPQGWVARRGEPAQSKHQAPPHAAPPPSHAAPPARDRGPQKSKDKGRSDESDHRK